MNSTVVNPRSNDTELFRLLHLWLASSENSLRDKILQEFRQSGKFNRQFVKEEGTCKEFGVDRKQMAGLFEKFRKVDEGFIYERLLVTMVIYIEIKLTNCT